MSRWSHALTKAANFFGWAESNHWSDAELVDKIVKSVVNLPVLSATEFPVEILQSRVDAMFLTIKNKSTREVCMIEIWGDQGHGKTTLPNAIYNQIHCTFKEKSFIENILQVSGIRGYLPLLEELYESGRIIDWKESMIRETLSGKRVLIVLDDVPYNYELLALWTYNHYWFSEGTVIIITTSDEDLLICQRTDSLFWIERRKGERSLVYSWPFRSCTQSYESPYKIPYGSPYQSLAHIDLDTTYVHLHTLLIHDFFYNCY
ncbi:disease resistance protein RPV1-like [Vigna umbellata]|uniref:disease resistance protein RPV1-like n=1 Tax=Vigna umbellata TaxID=87088 RepID=UPI001F5F4954|nr:disease resistance protein RPV1-like [Vigna umbellata]